MWLWAGIELRSSAREVPTLLCEAIFLAPRFPTDSYVLSANCGYNSTVCWFPLRLLWGKPEGFFLSYELSLLKAILKLPSSRSLSEVHKWLLSMYPVNTTRVSRSSGLAFHLDDSHGHVLHYWPCHTCFGNPSEVCGRLSCLIPGLLKFHVLFSAFGLSMLHSS